MKHIDLPEEYALVLQEIGESKGQKFMQLARSLHFDPAHLAKILRKLQRGGLVLVSSSTYEAASLRLTRKGQDLIRFIWPEARSYA